MPKEPRQLNKGKQRLRPRARLIRAIGQDLISSPVIAAVELIKNAYDADATAVTIKFIPPLVRGTGSIVVSDDGHGMPLTILRTAWWEPATARKKQVRTSPGGRPLTGEKGLGRFAVARLARELHVESTVLSPKRRLVVAHFDWSLFDNDEKFLDEIQASWAEYVAPRGAEQGTVLTLDQLRDDWDEAAFEELHGELARVVAAAGLRDAFKIVLKLPMPYRRFAGRVVPPPALARPHYALNGSVDAAGNATGTLVSNDVTRALGLRLLPGDEHEFPCGPFTFEFKVWDRDQLDDIAHEVGSTIRDVRRDLNAASGVSVYRDAFRVMPYGGLGDDWLRLDNRRIQNPTLRISNNQIVGSIHITAANNPELRDQTNREGLVDGDALSSFRAALKALIAQVETIRYECRRERKKAPLERTGLFASVSLDSVRTAFRDKYPGDLEFQHYLDERAATIGAVVERVQQVVARYRRLATLGQLIDVVLHDGRTPIAGIGNACVLAERDLDKATDVETLKSRMRDRIVVIKQQARFLSDLFQRVSPFGGRKRGRPSPRPIEVHIQDAFANYSKRAHDLGVRVLLPTTSTVVTADPAEMQQVFLNLFDNSLYWLESVPRDRRAIRVGCARVGATVEVEVSDSGPGIPQDNRQLIFDPYFSTKPDGIGLGLTIVGETIAEYDGTLVLLEEGLLPGASFRITLRDRVGDRKVASEPT